MALPGHVKYLIIGAGIHGLSTAYHLASSLKAKGNGAAADILVVDKTEIAAGASGIACGVVRNNYYQPAMRRADGGLRGRMGERPRGLPLPSRGLHADQPREHAQPDRRDRRAAAGDRLRVRVRRGRGRECEVHAGPVRRLAGARHHLGPAREEGRLRPQQGLDAGARGQGDRRPARASLPGSRSRASALAPTRRR